MRDLKDKFTSFGRSLLATFALASVAACTTLPRNPSSSTSLPELVTATCANADMILIGDTDHTNNAIHAAVATSAFSKALADCGVKKRFDEQSTSFLPTVEKFESGQLTKPELAKAYDASVYNFFNVPDKAFKAENRLAVDIIANSKKYGIRFIPADPMNGAVNLIIYQTVVKTELDTLEKLLPVDERPYFQLWLKNRQSEIPAGRLPAFNQHLEAGAKDPKVLELNAIAEKYHIGFDERHQDGGTVDIIRKNLRPGEKGMIMYGQGHMKTPGDLNDRLAKFYRTVRIDIFDSVNAIKYDTSDVKPDYAYALREKKTIAFGPAAQPH